MRKNSAGLIENICSIKKVLAVITTMTTIISIFKQSAMERSASTAVKDDVASAAEETLQFDDDNLRGEKLK